MKAWKLCALGVAMAALFAATAQAEPLKLRIQWPSFPGNITPMIPEVPKEVYRHYGVTYTVEPVFMAGSSQALTALAAGELEIATFTPQALALAVVEAKLDVRVIAQALSTDVAGYSQTSFWVRKDEVAKIEDLKGKVIAVNGRGTAVGAAAILMMKRKGFQENRDYQVVEVTFPNMLAALESKRVDAAYVLRPWDQQAAKNPALKPLFGMGDVYGRNETGIWAAKTDFIVKNRAALVDFLEDNVRMRRWTEDPKTRPDAIKLAAKIGKQSEQAYAWLYTKQDTSYRAPDLQVDLKALQSNTNDMKEGGLVPTTIEAGKYVDMSLAKEAVSRVHATH